MRHERHACLPPERNIVLWVFGFSWRRRFVSTGTFHELMGDGRRADGPTDQISRFEVARHGKRAGRGPEREGD